MGEKNTIQSVSLEFIRTIQDFSQYLSYQKGLGNTNFTLSKQGLERLNGLGKPRKEEIGFSCQGPENADLFFVDSEGSFFKGESGGLLVKILNAMKLTPESVFICNATDAGAIHARIKKHSPKILISLGQGAGQLLLNITSPVEQFRGKIHLFHGIPVMPTFHPSVLLEQPALKRRVWEDMQEVMKRAGLSP